MIDLLRKLIEKSGNKEITYEQFMGLVLYDQEKGYYMRDTEKVGPRGDFITSSNISNVFGKLFANVFAALLTQDKVSPVICEIGGGNGRFAKAVLEELKGKFPDIYATTTYIMIEMSPYHRSLQKKILPIGSKVIHYSSLLEAKEHHPHFSGIVFSNELFDAFPVRVVEKMDNCLYEVKISIDDNNPVERLTLLTDNRISEYLTRNEIQLVNGQRFEVPLAMLEFLDQMNSFVTAGAIFTVDYGYTNVEWMEPSHRNGSLRGYYKHQLIENPLLHPGEMDITTHIHFDSLINYGEERGFKLVSKMRQDEFLVEAGILSHLEENYDPNPFSEKSKQNRAIRSLITDGGMSTAFHVVIQEKSVAFDWNRVLKVK